MYLLIDECCATSLIDVAKAMGHTPQRTIEIDALGRGASDLEIHRFANRSGAIIVTNNHDDYKRLAAVGRGHPGIILMPDVVGREAAKLFAKVLLTAEDVFRAAPNMFVQIDESGDVRTFQKPKVEH